MEDWKKKILISFLFLFCTTQAASAAIYSWTYQFNGAIEDIGSGVFVDEYNSSIGEITTNQTFVGSFTLDYFIADDELSERFDFSSIVSVKDDLGNIEKNFESSGYMEFIKNDASSSWIYNGGTLQSLSISILPQNPPNPGIMEIGAFTGENIVSLLQYNFTPNNVDNEHWKLDAFDGYWGIGVSFDDYFGGKITSMVKVTGSTVPVPTTISLLGIGLLGLAGVSRRKF